jgi:hypothetical protein
LKRDIVHESLRFLAGVRCIVSRISVRRGGRHANSEPEVTGLLARE